MMSEMSQSSPMRMPMMVHSSGLPRLSSSSGGSSRPGIMPTTSARMAGAMCMASTARASRKLVYICISSNPNLPVGSRRRAARSVAR